jgi:chemotaxis protein histidine kinase CheA
MQFNASVIISEQLNRLMVNAAQELAQRAVSACAEHYKFDAEEAIGLLGLNNVKLERKSAVKDEEVKEKVVMPKPKFPLPYNGELNDTYCYALRQNNGLYTQCLGVRKGEAKFCKSCAAQMLKRGEDVPEYGTIQQRQAAGILEYVDPKGRKPIAYIKLMKKYKISQEDVIEEAGKFNITINDIHFTATEEENKRGRRPKNQDIEEKVKGVKGRPKKEKSVIQIEGDDDDDLFAALVEEANAEEHNVSSKKKVVLEDDDEKLTPKDETELSEEEKEANEHERIELELKKEQERIEREAKKKAEEAEKAEKAAKKEQERIEREAKKKAEEAEKAEKAAKKEQERIEREAKKKAEEAEKAEKAAKKEQERIEREAKKKAEEEGKKKKPSQEEEPETDVVKKIVYDGKKYLQSKKTGIIYDYNKYVTDGDQVKVGMWNATTEKIDYYDDEESEEEYEEDEE